MKKQDLFKKLCGYIEEIGQDSAYVSYKERGKILKHVILFREKDDLFIISNNFEWDGASPNSTAYRKYGKYSWAVTKDQSFYRNVIPETNFRVVTKEELAELLDTTPDATIIIKDTKAEENLII